MTIDVSLIPQNRVENLISKLSEIENNIGNIGTDITNNLVHKTGDETISGTKTFTSPIQRTASLGGGGSFLIKLTDSNGKGSVNQSSYYVNGVLYNRLNIINSSSGKEGYIEIQHNDNGEYRGVIGGNGTNLSLTKASSSTTENEIPTKGWVNNPATSTNVVHKTGNETINGIKTFSGTSAITYLKSTEIDRTTPPSSGYQFAYIDVIDKNNNRLGVLGGKIGPDGKYGTYLQAGNEANVSVKSDGTNGYFEFPRCTTAATTTSTAANDKVAVVVQNYSSGTNWYRIWSDGWIEQGGITNYMNWTGNGATVNITFLKPMSNTNYHRGATMLDHTSNWNAPGCCINSCNTSGMAIGVATTSANQGTTRCSWYACGY